MIQRISIILCRKKDQKKKRSKKTKRIWTATRMNTMKVVMKTERLKVVMKKGLVWTRVKGVFPCTAVSQGFSWTISKVRVGMIWIE